MKFNTEAEYNAFITLYKASKAAVNVVPLTVFVDNRNETKTANFYMDFETELDRNSSTKAYKSFTVEIEEA